jgi:uncharacterized protein
MKKFFFCLLVITAVFTGGVPVRAQDLQAEKTRMDARLPKVDALKAKGAIGENNRGLLEVRSQDAEAAGIVSAENRDREAVYAALAKKEGTSADQVGRARAKQLAARSAPGVWVQKEDGSWAKK